MSRVKLFWVDIEKERENGNNPEEVFEHKINAFIKDKKVVSIGYSGGDSRYYEALICYDEVEVDEYDNNEEEDEEEGDDE